MPTRRKSPKHAPLAQLASVNDDITDADIEAAVSIIRADYYREVRAIAQDLEREVKKGEITSQEQLDERLTQEVDGSARVIYTFKSKLGLLASDNEDAYEDEMGEEPKDIAVKMAFAMLADINQILPLFDFDD